MSSHLPTRASSCRPGWSSENGYQVDAVRRWVELILRQYLAPVPPFGPDGRGWPLGRTIRRAELEAVAVQVEGVEYLEDDLLLAEKTDSGLVEVTSVSFARWELPELVQITVVGGKPLPIGTDIQPPPRRWRTGAAASGGVLMDGDRTMSVIVDTDQWFAVCASQHSAA